MYFSSNELGQLKLFFCYQGGTYFFIEHVAYDKKIVTNLFWTLVRNNLDLLWAKMYSGCQLKRTSAFLENAGFNSTMTNESFPENLPGIFKFIWGCAVK